MAGRGDTGLPHWAPGEDYEFWARLIPHLKLVTSAAAGFAVEFYWGAPPVTGLGSEAYQVMPESARDERRPFWAWYLGNKPQWHPTPIEAASAFVEAFRKFRDR